ncbi:hypothetical protein [Hyalangium minutum]|uniref:Lipoprotein n=1 Tax=Hyalangium minutum TaxID=394096 RepID=A0A085WTM5_9BACT|nr:hypothetical protein [Hyalangium minutum]KFE71038.1 hypothetical protein DB31_3168 [Hyalangium minutum]
MRSLKWAVAVVAATSFLGCGGNQPSIYRVAVQRVTAENTPAGCYVPGQAPTTINDKSTNLVDRQQWVLWEGIEDAVYLEPGNINYNIGQAENVAISADTIQGTKADGKHTFTSERTRSAPNEVYTTSATYTIDKLGSTIEGALLLRSVCTGANCDFTTACEVTLTYSGIKIDADQFSVFTPSPGT